MDFISTKQVNADKVLSIVNNDLVEYIELFKNRVNEIVNKRKCSHYKEYNKLKDVKKMETIELIFDDILLVEQNDDFYNNLLDLYLKARGAGIFVTIMYHENTILPDYTKKKIGIEVG